MSELKIANDVVANIAANAAMEAAGVAAIAGKTKKSAKGIALQIENNNVSVSLDILVHGGSKIQDVAKDVQQRVKTAIETMTGYTATSIIVHVSGLVA